MATVSQDPKMSWTNAAIGLLMTQSGWAGDAARDERLEAVVRGVIVGGGCQLAWLRGQVDCMHSMLSSIDAAAAAEAAQLLQGELAARELLQAVVDRISGAPL
jgi:hypothetical protein